MTADRAEQNRQAEASEKLRMFARLRDDFYLQFNRANGEKVVENAFRGAVQELRNVKDNLEKDATWIASMLRQADNTLERDSLSKYPISLQDSVQKLVNFLANNFK